MYTYIYIYIHTQTHVPKGERTNYYKNIFLKSKTFTNIDQ